MSELINTNRFFSDVLPYIGNKDNIIEELIENSVRAKAKKVDFNFNDITISCVNDGDVLDDFTSLLTVGTTNYDKDVIENQHPAGMGIMMMLSSSEKAVFSSGNKSLAIHSKRFFSDVEYRAEISALLDNQELLINEKDYIDGFEVVLTVDSSFLKSIKKSVFSNLDSASSRLNYKFVDSFKYYNLDIFINRIQVQRDEPKWIVNKVGEGIFSGCKIGIECTSSHYSNYNGGRIIWFGKTIDCDEIAPFTIVVNGSTNCVTPALPDRIRLADSRASLDRLKIKLERALFSEIQDYIANKTSWVESLLGCLCLCYDVEHLTRWDDALLDDYKLGYSGYMNCTINGRFRDDVLACSDSYSGNVFDVRKIIGGTLAPKWILDRFKTRFIIDVSFYKDDTVVERYIGNSCVTLVESIVINGVSVDWVLLSDDDLLYFTPNVNDDFIGMLMDKDSFYDIQCSENDYIDDFNTIMNLFYKRIDLLPILNPIVKLLNIKIDDLVNINFDTNSDSLNVVLKNGSRHNVLVA